MKKILLVPTLGLLLLGSSIHASDDLVIAPPPVSYSALKTVGIETNIGVNYLSYTADSIDMTGYGASVTVRKRTDEDSIHNFGVGINLLDADMDTQSGDGTIGSFSYLYGHNLSKSDDATLIGFVGANYIVTSLSFEVPYGATSGSDVYIDTYMFGVNAGVQYEMKTSFGAFIPWAFFLYSQGTSDLEIYTYGAGGGSTTSTADIDPTLTSQFGLDLYFSSIGTSLSSMYQSNDSGDMFTLSLNYNF